MYIYILDTIYILYYIYICGPYIRISVHLEGDSGIPMARHYLLQELVSTQDAIEGASCHLTFFRVA